MKNSRLTLLLALAAMIPAVGLATPASDQLVEVEPQVAGGLDLPCWQPDECQGNFDIRIWPEELVLWLEQENLRSMVNDPEIPAEERAALKRILAMQTAFTPRGT